MKGGFHSLPALACFAWIGFGFSISLADSPSPASLTRLRAETRQLLRQHAEAGSAFEKDSAARALCDLYVVLRSDVRYAKSEMLRGDAAKVRHRLLSIARMDQARLRRSGIERPNMLSSQVDRALASDHLAAIEPSAAGGGGPVADQGWQLVELIQRIVDPDFWEPHGGPGAIRYFAIRRVLVVRATSDVHGQIRDLLMALR